MIGCKMRGFTLFEIVITMTVIGILAAIAVPSFVNMLGRVHARDLAESISSGLDSAKAYAINSARVVTYSSQADCSWTVSVGTTIKKRSEPLPRGVSCQATGTGDLYLLPDGSITKTTGTPLSAPTSTLLYTLSSGGNTWRIALYPSGLSTADMAWQ